MYLSHEYFSHDYKDSNYNADSDWTEADYNAAALLVTLSVGTSAYIALALYAEYVVASQTPAGSLSYLSAKSAACAFTASGTALNMGTGLGIAKLGLATCGAAVAAILVAKGTQKFKIYMTRYEVPKDDIENALNKLLCLKNAGKMLKLKQYILDNYSPSWFSSSNSSYELYYAIKDKTSAASIYKIVNEYLSRQDDSGEYHNNGKRLNNLILEWISEVMQPSLKRYLKKATTEMNLPENPARFFKKMNKAVAQAIDEQCTDKKTFR